MKLKTLVALLGAMALLGTFSAADDGNSAPPITMTPLKGSLHLMTVTGGEEFGLPPFGTNLVASIGPDGILLVDAGFTTTASVLKDTLATFGSGKVKIIINTHDHGDHTFGNRTFKDNAVILAHRLAVSRLSGNYLHLSGTPSPNRPHVGFDDSLIIHFNGEEIHVIHAPGRHTGGDVYVYFTDSKIVAAGDLIFSDEIPYVDLGGRGTIQGYVAGIKSFIDDFPPEVSFIASHGRPYDRDDLIEYYDMLTATTDLIRNATAAGKTVDQMIADSLLADWADWNGSFATTTLEAWIRTVSYELTQGDSGRQSICEPLTLVLVSGSVTDAVSEYNRLKSTMPDKYDFDEGHLNMLGYQLLLRQRVNDAVEIFKLNVANFPESFNVYDSYGEALMAKGDTSRSIVNYEKSLELNPENINAVEMLKRLRP